MSLNGTENLRRYRNENPELFEKSCALGGKRAGKVRRMRRELRIMLERCQNTKRFREIKKWIMKELGEIYGDTEKESEKTAKEAC